MRNNIIITKIVKKKIREKASEPDKNESETSKYDSNPERVECKIKKNNFLIGCYCSSSGGFLCKRLIPVIDTIIRVPPIIIRGSSGS